MMEKIFTYQASNRITAAELLNHPFLKEERKPVSKKSLEIDDNPDHLRTTARTEN